MKTALIIKNANFSANAVEIIDLINAPLVTILFGVGGVVTLSAKNPDAIYYTVDGSEPTTDSTEYVDPFTVAGETVVKAIAVYPNGKTSDVSTAIFNAGDEDILYKLNYTLGYSTSGSTTLTEIALTDYAISDYIPVPGYSNLNVNYGADVQTMGMWTDYYKFKIVEYDKDKVVVVSSEARANDKGSKIAVGSDCIWSIREGQNNLSYKNVPVQQETRYIKIVVEIGTSANVTDKSNNNVLFQYIPDNS